MDANRRNEILKRGGLSLQWQGEPHLGGHYGQEEIDAVVACMKASMAYNEGFGFITEDILEFERRFAEYIGSKHAVSINGAGAGLDMAMMVLNLEPEDEVIVPALNFRSAPLSVLGRGAKLIICDCDPRTFQADPADVERRITKNTRAIYPVHMNGMPAPMDELLEIASRHEHHKHGRIKVIGDAARSLGGGWTDGSKIGSKADITVFSFHTMKNMTTLGEGGAVNTSCDETHQALRGIRQFGNETSGWGTNYKMTRVQAAVGMVQLKRLPDFMAGRKRIAEARTRMLEGIPHLELPYVPEGVDHSWYLYTLLVEKDWAGDKRNALMKTLLDDYGVDSVVANPPVSQIDGIIKEACKGQSVPVSDELGQRLFCVPTHPMMSDEDNEYICAALWDAVEKTA